MFEQYTTSAVRARVLAKEIAAKMGQGYVGTEHMLLGMLREGSGVAGQVLAANGVEIKVVEKMVKELIAPEIPIALAGVVSPRAEKILK